MLKIISKFIILPLMISISSPAFNNEDDIKSVITNYFNAEILASQGNEYLFENVTIEYKEELNCRLEFYKKWAKLQNYKFDKYEQKVNVAEIRKGNECIKAFIERDIDFNLQGFKEVQKSLGEKYCIHIKEEDSKFRIDKIIYEEENPDIYINEYEGREEWRAEEAKYKEKIKDIDKMYRDYKAIIKNNGVRGENFNREKTIAYAQKYALDYNKAYNEFDSYDQGGDCTNFVSQCIHAGGLPYTNEWKPYSPQWLQVGLCRDYLVNKKIAKEYNYISPDMVGGVVQFYNIEKNKWAHSGIITQYTGGEYLFCCHSYDKLNYPLSMRYPTIYPKIRMLIIQ
ncbi:MAG: amidase domain-containing protein [Clostridium sp.]